MGRMWRFLWICALVGCAAQSEVPTTGDGARDNVRVAVPAARANVDTAAGSNVADADDASGSVEMTPGLRAAYVRARQGEAGIDYAFERDGDRYTGRSVAQGLRATVGIDGARIEPESDGERAWSLGLALRAVGRAGAMQPVKPLAGSLDGQGNRAWFEHAGGVAEWYLSGPLGIEQGFELAVRPEGDGEELRLEVAVKGGFVAEPGASRSEARLRETGGDAVVRYTDLVAYDAGNAVLRAWMTVERGVIVLHVADAGARYPLVVDPLAWTQVRKLVASDPADDDIFGESVAVSGGVAIVGAFLEDGTGTDRGAAYVFERNLDGADYWSERTKLAAGDAGNADWFGRSVGISGDLAIVGAHGTDDGGQDRGAAYVFERDLGGADTWGERKKLSASDAQDSDVFGYSVAISGDVAIVGAYGEDGAGGGDARRGAAYVFERNLGGADNWGQRKKLTASDPEDVDIFGQAVAISGDVTTVGASGEDGLGANRGAAYVFERNFGGADNWGERKKLAASDAQDDDVFGTSVAISGDVVVIGAPRVGTDRGAAYLFERDLGAVDNWGERKILSASDAQNGNWFGISVAVAENLAVVGASGEDGAGVTRGAAYLFERDFGAVDNWGERKKLIASDPEDFDQLGISVAISGTVAILGANYEDGAGSNRGAAYVFGGRGLGASCDEPGDCESDHCVDGVCCDTDCGGGSTTDCIACSVGAGGAADGTCGPRTDGLACDDDLFCTGTETCTGGVCGGSSGDPCVANVGDADNDCSESCSEAADDCSADDPDSSSCTDDLFCTGTETCTGGVCGGSSGDPCVANVGDADNDCSESCSEAADDCSADDPDSSSCTDDLFCTGTETCTGGACGGSSGDPCAANVGDADNDCSESCNEAADDCSADDPDSSSCTDDLFCTGTEACSLGACSGSTGDPCATNVGDEDDDCSESCNEVANACSANDPSSAACDDGLTCNGADQCTAGACDVHAVACPLEESDAGNDADAGAAGSGGSGSGAGGAGADGGAPVGTAGTTGTGGTGGGTGGTSDAGVSPDAGALSNGDSSGCGCRVAPRVARPYATLVALVLIGVLAARFRRRCLHRGDQAH